MAGDEVTVLFIYSGLSGLQGLVAEAVSSFKTIFVVVDGDIGVINGQRSAGKRYGCGFGLVTARMPAGFAFAGMLALFKPKPHRQRVSWPVSIC